MAHLATRAAVRGLGVYIPERILTNEDLARMVDTSDEWITARTGIKRRHLAAPDQTTGDLALIAAERALADAGMDAGDLDLVIVAETLSRLIDWEDRRTSILIGDGAGAAVLVPSTNGRGLYSGVVGADGSAGEVLKVAAGGSRPPVSKEAIERKQHRAYMDGQAVFKLAVRTVPGVVREAVARAGWTLDQVDRVVPHQANLRIIEAMREQLGLPQEKFEVNIEEYGNTSAASVPIALYEGVRAGRIREDHRIVLAAFGGGFTYAACTLVWGY